MSFLNVKAGNKIPDEMNVIIEIPLHGGPIKYEMNKETGTLWVDRLMTTSMSYPANYGFIPQTLSEDGDPVDVLVVTPVPIIHGAIICCRPIGMLKMTDEAGVDAKLLAVPLTKASKCYDNIRSYEDLPSPYLKTIEHFFKHYKDLEEGKWVKLDGWEGCEVAKQEILNSVKRYQQKNI